MEKTARKKSEKVRSPHDRGTESRTFRLRSREIQFLESLAGEQGITAGLRRLITFGMAVGCEDDLLQTGGADAHYALLTRIERLERRLEALVS